MLRYLAVGGVAFQLVHMVEHLAQAAFWVMHPTAIPWLTPWAAAGRDALSSDPATGAELLHLVGNAVFLAALAALTVLTARLTATDRSFLRQALWVQGFHVFEHLLLTVSWLLVGRALGFSTLFGMLDGAALSSFRVVWHFLINLSATGLALRAFLHHLPVWAPQLAPRRAPQPTA